MEHAQVSVVSGIAGVALAVLLAAACWYDVRTRRIPNRLVLAGIAAGLALNALAPAGYGLFSALRPGAIGLSGAVGGLLAGIGLFLPLYLIRGMGAGDVKLMGMVGAFLGPLSVLGASLTTLAAGGILAGAVALWKGTLVRAVGNVRFMLLDTAARVLCGQGVQLAQTQTSAGKVPYALAIAGGTFVHLLLLRTGHSFFSQ